VSAFSLAGCAQDAAFLTGPTPTLRATGTATVTDAVVIWYAQGTESGTLHLQWTGPLVCSLEVWYSLNGPDVDTLIASQAAQNFSRGELMYPAGRGGRYRVVLCGVTSRLLYLDGVEDGGGRASQPSPSAPTLPPVEIPRCTKNSDDPATCEMPS